MRIKDVPSAVVTVVSVWKTNNALQSPWASKVKLPAVIVKVPGWEQCTPGNKVFPARSELGCSFVQVLLFK